MLNDARVASHGFFMYNVCTTRINKEKKFKIKFQVPLKLAWILPDFLIELWNITFDIYQNFGFNATFINLKSALTYITLLTFGLLNSIS